MATTRRNMAKGRQLNFRTYVQRGGSLPGNNILYLNKSRGQLRAGGLTFPQSGTSQIVRPSDDTYGRFDLLGLTESAPEQGTITLNQDMTEEQVGFLEEIKIDGDVLGVHLLEGQDGDAVGDPQAWRKKYVIPFASLTSFAFGTDAQGADSDEIQMLVAELAYTDYNVAVRVAWQELIGSQVTTPLRGATFGKSRRHKFFVGEGDGALATPYLLHTVNDSTYTKTNITELAATAENPSDIAYVGGYVIIPTAANSYVYFDEDDVTTRTEVSGGFVATKTPNAVYAQSLARIFFAAEDGYIYLLTNIGNAVTVLTDGTITAQDLNHIHGKGDHIVAVGDANVVLKSANNGDSWVLKTGPIAATVLNCVQVLENDVYVVGAADGNAYYTLDGGDTWTSMPFPGSGTGSVTAILFLADNPAFGILAHQNGTPEAKVYRTTDGGNKWESTTLTGFPASNKVNDFAMWDPNTLISAGVGTVTTDGTLASAKTTRSD